MSDSAGDLLRETAARVFEEYCPPEVLRAADTGTWQTAAWDAIAEAGLHHAMLPESAGGYGVAVADAMSLLRVAGEYSVPLPLAETMLASWILGHAGVEVPAGPLTVAPVVAGETVTLDGTDGKAVLTGSVSRIPWGRDAVAAAVLAQRAGQTVVALVLRDAWTVTPEENVAREPRDTLHFTGPVAAVAPTNLTEQDLRAAGAAMRAQQMAGGLVRLAAMTTQYAQDRIQFGRPIGKFQAVQQNLAVLAGQTAAACAAADLAAEAVGDKMRLLPIAAGKARAGEAAGIGASIAHQVHGAIGFTFEHTLHFVTRRLWSWRDEFGNETSWNRVIGRHMATIGADSIWAEITAA